MGRRHEPQPAVGLAIRQLRAERGLKQIELARAADVNRTEMSNLERGHLNPAWGTVRRVARALEVEVSEIAALAEQIEREGPPEPNGPDTPPAGDEPDR
jgi:DNA-binding XRE family transcriptional regulator